MGKGVGLQQSLDPGGDDFALVKYCLERVGEAGDDQCGRVRARDDDGLLVECGEDFVR
ncbi:hypothetical protein GCM10022284_68910 [Streptomyces hundungensis]